MNFLSHFYFESESSSAEQVMGAVLPDLLKIAEKKMHLFPEKTPALFQDNIYDKALLNGWIRHLDVDKKFHSSLFFQTHTNGLKPLIQKAIVSTPIRPSFLAHIGLELLLDRLLLTNNWIHENDFYSALANCPEAHTAHFLEKAGQEDQSVFFRFLELFVKERYLGSYRHMGDVSFALNQICKRLWPYTFSSQQKNALTDALYQYEALLSDEFSSIFKEIALHLDKKNQEVDS